MIFGDRNSVNVAQSARMAYPGISVIVFCRRSLDGLSAVAQNARFAPKPSCMTEIVRLLHE